MCVQLAVGTAAAVAAAEIGLAVGEVVVVEVELAAEIELVGGEVALGQQCSH